MDMIFVGIMEWNRRDWKGMRTSTEVGLIQGKYPDVLFWDNGTVVSHEKKHKNYR
jgi:hypothetical protein